ncbi:SDR family NAD(P)-dependent oxidoreductase [Plastoroseomonas hellenica]|uniref:SDR family NAD(P)-dependent oxidoreductase n=1 Tax=Plastoroseomonas hellenica TaxID=2687306 RepID=UPI001BA861C8|nr:glucose 1-dehydrogenase [Plastoroseomonas hellenica]MBR0643687.1 glucose 1-dehydrogenase [Plastoroseomonas hellenica]
MFDLSGRVALVTGGNGGIGLGMARGLAKAGAAVMIAGRDAAKNEAALAELRALGAEAEAVIADLTDPEAVKAMVAETVKMLGGLDILVNNAGTNIRRRPEDYRLEDWHTVLATNLTSAMLASQAAYPHLKASGHGRVINNGSMLSIFGLPFHAAYGASKGGVVQMTKSLAVAWAADGITVNVLLPGWIDTALTQKARGDMPTLHEDVLRRTPTKRWGDPKDFEGIAAFLGSDASAFITGVAIPVDGGFSVHG